MIKLSKPTSRSVLARQSVSSVEDEGEQKKIDVNRELFESVVYLQSRIDQTIIDDNAETSSESKRELV